MTPTEQKAFDAMREALRGASNYIDTLGGISLRYRQVIVEANALSHPKPETAPATEGRAITSESAANAVSVEPQAQGEAALPMDTAPTNGTIVRLLVDFEDNSLEDTDQPLWTIGACYASDAEGAEWQFAGWNWSHDCFTEGHGKPIGWLPMLDAAYPQATEPAGYKLMPVEPTPAMLYAIQNDCDILPPRGKRIWAAMLAAAPKQHTNNVQE